MNIIPAIHFANLLRWKRIVSLGVIILCLVVPVSSPLVATTNAPPAQPAAPAGDDGFGQYLVDHQDDLAPFFANNGAELIQESTPLFIVLLGKIMFFTLLVGWLFDVLQSRWFSAFFAPAYANLQRALLYASGRLVISIVVTALIGLMVIFILGHPHSWIVFFILICIFVIAAFVVEVIWLCYLYKMNVPNAAMFFLTIIAAHFFTVILVATPILGGHATESEIGFIDHTLTPKLQTEVDAAKHDLAVAAAARDEIAAQVDEARNRIARAGADQERMEKQIEQKKNSEEYLLSQIAQVRAKGDLAATRDQLSELLTKYPNGPLTGQIKTQLSQVNSDLTARETQTAQAAAAEAQAKSQAQADLMAKANKGEATLSEMRVALLGKTPAEISALFGPPVATDSNRWGYNKRMVFNPLSGAIFGLAVYFSDGTVQSVDYYYGH